MGKKIGFIVIDVILIGIAGASLIFSAKNFLEDWDAL